MKSKLILVDKNKKMFSEGIYHGQLQNGKANGFGIYERNNGYRYEGEWLNDIASGIGIVYLKDNSIIKGEILNGKANGFCIFESLEEKYEGNYINDTRTGNGIMTIYKYGEKYIGQFYNGVFSGFGKLIWADGSFLIGEWEKDLQKKGISFYNEDKGFFDAIWDLKKENNITVGTGKGIYYFPDGRKQNRIRVINPEKNLWQ